MVEIYNFEWRSLLSTAPRPLLRFIYHVPVHVFSLFGIPIPMLCLDILFTVLDISMLPPRYYGRYILTLEILHVHVMFEANDMAIHPPIATEIALEGIAVPPENSPVKVKIRRATSDADDER